MKGPVCKLEVRGCLARNPRHKARFEFFYLTRSFWYVHLAFYSLPRNFLYFRTYAILELHLRVIWRNTCSSIIVSTHHPENVQLTTYESKRFFKDVTGC